MAAFDGRWEWTVLANIGIQCAVRLLLSMRKVASLCYSSFYAGLGWCFFGRESTPHLTADRLHRRVLAWLPLNRMLRCNVDFSASIITPACFLRQRSKLQRALATVTSRPDGLLFAGMLTLAWLSTCWVAPLRFCLTRYSFVLAVVRQRSLRPPAPLPSS